MASQMEIVSSRTLILDWFLTMDKNSIVFCLVCFSFHGRSMYNGEVIINMFVKYFTSVKWKVFYA